MPSLARLAPALLLLSLLGGCSCSTPRALPDGVVTPGASRKAEPVEAPPDPSDEEALERYELKSVDGALSVEVAHMTGTGTMHYAERLRIEHKGQVVERRSRVDESSSQMAPLVDRIVPLSGGRYLLLGWASSGSGQQQDHALLIGTSQGKLALLDELVSSTHRAHAALFVRTQGAPAIGVPGDPASIAEDRHDDRWSFSTLSGALDGPQFLSLRGAFTSSKAPGVLRYAPPFHQPSDEERKVVWFEIESGRIRLPEVLVDPSEHLKRALDSSEELHIASQDQWMDLDGDGSPDVLRCVGDGCMASPCSSYKVYLSRPGGALFAGDIGGNLDGKARRLDQRHGGFSVIETWDGTARYRFERGRYRCFERRECKPEGGECSPWKPVDE